MTEHDHVHEWESGRWGVIIGVSKCRVCGRISQTLDFPTMRPGGDHEC